MTGKVHQKQPMENAHPPSVLRKLFAQEWIWTVGFIGIAVSIALCASFLAFPNVEQMIVLLLAGAAVGALLAWALTKLLWNAFIRINGGPFREGDWVEVITGGDAGKTGRVYEVWPSRNQVRVDLGEAARRERKDIFVTIQVRRVSPCCDRFSHPTETA